ncbi:MAG: hypothetical protein ACRD0M_04715, partial [Acidimicrobiales bacterium]
MGEHPAPGLTADWLNGWLAAVGVTVLVPGSRLAWTTAAVPAAKFSLPGDVPLVEVVAASLPSLAQLEDLAIARTIPGRPELPHKEVDLDVYRDRAELARATGDLSLSASVTDLLAKLDGGRLPHGPFDPGVPKGLTLWQRLRDCRTRLDDSPGEWLQRSFEGRGRRVELNGLG